MNYRLATEQETEEIYNIVQQTIKIIYPKYYPKEVVDFFCNHHNFETVSKDIKAGNVSVLVVDNVLVGTGSFVDNHITRVYVSPKHQGKGYGTYIIKTIENEIVKNHDKAVLDASLPAAHLYEKLGYTTVKHEKYPVKNGVILAYEVMEKELHQTDTTINYDGKCFVPKMNSENGEVDGQTLFTYHQNGNILWAEYSGGDVIRGTIIGTVARDGSLDFQYQHMNTEKQLRAGICHSTPRVMSNGKIELSEEWQWMTGDCSKGVSVLEEV